MRFLPLAAIWFALCLLSACRGEADGVMPGQTTLPQLLGRMGQPTMVWSEGDGSLQLEFSRVLDGGGNYMARVATDGVVVSLQQVLVESVADGLQLGMSQDQVRRKLGRPARIESNSDGEVWHWPLAVDGRPVLWQVDAHFGARGLLQDIQRRRVSVLPTSRARADQTAYS